MTRLLASVAVGVLLASSSAGATVPAAPVADRPSLACDAPVHDFGNLADAASVVHSFLLWNRGTAPLEISNVRACCGGAAKAAANRIAPGASTTVEVTLSLRGRAGPQDKSVYVASNDPAQPYFRLRLLGRVTPLVGVEPRSVEFRDLSPHSATGTLLTVAASLAGGSPTNAVPDVGWLKATLSPPRGGTTAVQLTTVPPLPKGVSQGKVRILFADSRVGPLEVPVTLSVPQEIAVLPSEVVLVGAPGQLQSAPRYLLLRSVRSEDFRVLRVDCPVPGWTSQASPAGPGAWRVRLDNLSVQGQAQDLRVRIVTDHPACPELAVPVKMVNP